MSRNMKRRKSSAAVDEEAELSDPFADDNSDATDPFEELAAAPQKKRKQPAAKSKAQKPKPASSSGESDEKNGLCAPLTGVEGKRMKELVDELFSPLNVSPKKASDALILKAQSELGVTFPDSFVQLLRVRNGGYARGSLWWGKNVNLPSISGVSTKKQFNTLPHMYALSHKEWGCGEWLIPLGGDGHGWVCLDYRKAQARSSGKAVPVVYCYQYNGYTPKAVAKDFDTFLHVIQAMMAKQ